jgi:prepilin-type N-terminal cleavage/methylation domain-containing protein
VAPLSGAAAARGERGFSLLELLVVMVLLSFTLAVGIGLLAESQRLFAGASRGAAETDETWALRRLKSDLRSLAPVGGGGLWSPGPLVLVAGPEEAVAWAVEGDRLVRARVASGAEAVSTPLLARLVDWRWRRLGAGFVEVEITRRVTPRPLAFRLLGPRWKERDERLETYRVAIAQRSSP